jgi:cytoskeletal protein CcmA (bactofilin family)
MSIFTKPTTEKVPMRTDSPSPDAGLSVIAAGMKIVGDIESTGVVKIEGVVEGAIRGARQLLLGRQGTVHGDIRAHEVVIGGVVIGTIVADERVEIQGTSSVQGDIHTKTIVVLEGGVINGAVRMGDAAVRDAGLNGARDGSRDTREPAAEPTPRPGLALTQ